MSGSASSARTARGKSTLVKTLAGTLPLAGGKRVEGRNLAIGYFAQHQLEQLDPDASALLHLQRIDGRATESALRSFLGGFGFAGDRALESVAPFSGGEKSRLALALLIWQKPNLLLLDEPTNHLDLEMRHALTVALQGYEGALVVVSHDRHLLRTCTDELFLVEGGGCLQFEGDLEDYRARVVSGENEGSAEDRTDRRQQRRDAAARRQQLQPLTRRINKLEQEMERLQQQLQAIATRLADPALYAETAKSQVPELLKEQGRLTAALESSEAQWLEASEELESLGWVAVSTRLMARFLASQGWALNGLV